MARKILYASPKETIEISYPNWLSFVMKFIFRYLKVKTIKFPGGRGAKTTAIYIDEFVNYPKKPKE